MFIFVVDTKRRCDLFLVIQTQLYTNFTRVNRQKVFQSQHKRIYSKLLWIASATRALLKFDLIQLLKKCGVLFKR